MREALSESKAQGWTFLTSKTEARPSSKIAGDCPRCGVSSHCS
jgi:hypothetical protein